MTTIAPSILSADFLNLQKEIETLNTSKDLWIHLDVMDGHFVPNLTFGQTVIKNLKTITPHKLDAHFMVENPEEYVESFKNVGLHNFTFHWEAVKHHDSLLSKIKSIYPSAGISLNPSTPVGIIPEYMFEKLDLVLIMSVNPGFGGQSFIQGSIDKIKELGQIKKDRGLSFEIQVDGGVSDKNAKELIEAGATNLVAGSYIFGEPNKDYASRIQSLRN